MRTYLHNIWFLLFFNLQHKNAVGCSIIIQKDLKRSGRKHLEWTTKKWNFFIRLSFLKIHCRSFSDGLCAHVAALYIDYSCFYFSVQREETCKVTFKCKKKPLHTKCAAMKTFLKILALHSMQNEILVFCYTQPKKKNFHFLGEWSEKLPRIVHAHPNLSCTVDCGGVKRVRTNQNLISVKKNWCKCAHISYVLCTVLCSFQIIFVFFFIGKFFFGKEFLLAILL